MREALDTPGSDGRPVSFQGAGGITLRGDAWGVDGAPPVLLLHGGGQTRHSWSGTAARLGAAGWYAVSLDLRGHGESDWSPGGSYDVEDFVGDLRAVAEALPRAPVVVGASLGGMTALLAEGEGPGPVTAGVVLVDVTPRLEPEGVLRIIGFMTAQPDGFGSLEEAADAIAAFRQHRERPTDLSGLSKNLRRGRDGRWRWHWDPDFVTSRPLAGAHDHGFRNSTRLLDAARNLRVPTLLVRGRESDVVSQEGADEFLEAVPHAAYVDVSQAGHMVAGDRNDVFTGAVVDFLREAFA